MVTRGLKQYRRYRSGIFFTKADSPDTIYYKDLERRKASLDTGRIGKIFFKLTGDKPVKIVENGPSTLHRVFRITSANQDYITRLSLMNSRYSDPGFFVEKKIVDNLSKIGLMSQKWHSIDTTRSEIPFDFEIKKSIKGISLYDTSKKQTIDPKLHYQLGLFVAKVHTIKTDGFGYLDPEAVIFHNRLKGLHSSWKSYLLINLEKHLMVCQKSGIINNLTRIRIKKIFSQIREKDITSQFKPTLLHGDLSNHNALSKGAKLTGLIDWEDSISGDPVFDISYWGTGSIGNPTWLSSFIKGYQSQTPFSHDFDYRYWLYYLRIAISKAALRIKLGYNPTINGFSSSERIMIGLNYLV